MQQCRKRKKKEEKKVEKRGNHINPPTKLFSGKTAQPQRPSMHLKRPSPTNGFRQLLRSVSIGWSIWLAVLLLVPLGRCLWALGVPLKVTLAHLFLFVSPFVSSLSSSIWRSPVSWLYFVFLTCRTCRRGSLRSRLFELACILLVVYSLCLRFDAARFWSTTDFNPHVLFSP